MLMTMDQLMEAMGGEGLFKQVAEPEQEQVKVPFYIQFDKSTCKVCSISANPVPDGDNGIIEIDHELGLKFMSGEENHSNWSIGMQDKKYIIQKIDRSRNFVGNRIDVMRKVEEVSVSSESSDIMIYLDKVESEVFIHYDGVAIQNLGYPIKLYFTREGDPSHLKSAISLDVNILNAIKTDNSLDHWPNPLIVKLDDLDDISVYAAKGSLTISITENKHD